MYHITITNQKDGEILIDRDTPALLCAIHANPGVRGMTLLDCSAAQGAVVIDAATRTCQRALQEHPAMAVALLKHLRDGGLAEAESHVERR